MAFTVVLAYSGGLDTSIIVPWLRDKYDAEVICVAADVGQGEELSGLEARAKAQGAQTCIVQDLREPFVNVFHLAVPFFSGFSIVVVFMQQFAILLQMRSAPAGIGDHSIQFFDCKPI